jgi:exodeoxyribonuclease VII small subunit
MNQNSTAATAAPSSPEPREPRLTDHLRRLNEISRTMGAGQLDIEDALAMYEEGAGLHRQAKEILAQVRLRIALLDGESKGGGASEDVAVRIGATSSDLLNVEEDDLPF